MRQFRGLYENELRDNREAVQRIRELENENQTLKDVNNDLEQKVNIYEDHVKIFKVPKVYKKYHKLRSPTAKAQRKSQFKRCLNQSIVHLKEIRNAQLKLLIGNKDINLSWSQNELKELRSKHAQLPMNLPNDVQDEEEMDVDDDNGAVAADEEIDIDGTTSDTDFPDPFLPDGKWNTQHIRRVIHVLDSYHISHEAYHELRLSSRSILPPLHRIKNEKKIMSKGINYYTCGTVS